MARKRRRCPGGRRITSSTAPRRQRIFDDANDYLAFERVLAEARERSAGQLRLCCYVVMPNHFHLVLWPKTGAALSRFMQWLTLTHAQRGHAHRHSTGTGALYGSRFKNFALREDEHFLKACRYVERNPLRAGLVKARGHLALGKFAQARRSLSGQARSHGVARRMAGAAAAQLEASSASG
jgi:putative transposase